MEATVFIGIIVCLAVIAAFRFGFACGYWWNDFKKVRT